MDILTELMAVSTHSDDDNDDELIYHFFGIVSIKIFFSRPV